MSNLKQGRWFAWASVSMYMAEEEIKSTLCLVNRITSKYWHSSLSRLIYFLVSSGSFFLYKTKNLMVKLRRKIRTVNLVESLLIWGFLIWNTGFFSSVISKSSMRGFREASWFGIILYYHSNFCDCTDTENINPQQNCWEGNFFLTHI